MFSKIFSRPEPVSTGAPERTLALLDAPPPRAPKQLKVMRAILGRWKGYSSASIDETISPHDDMFNRRGAMEHYRSVGVSALEVITEAMLAAKRTEFARILDLPCGGGRVTRHLVKFFPDAKIYVSDIDKQKQAFVASQFGVEGVDAPPDFSTPSPLQYDLIFVGSLVTHLEEAMFSRMIDYGVAALAPDGLLVVSTHGRYAASKVKADQLVPNHVKKAIDQQFVHSGFSYVEFAEDRKRYGMSYGASFSSPAWIMQLLERRSDVAILGFKERGWAAYQDAVTVQKLPSADPNNRGSDNSQNGK